MKIEQAISAGDLPLYVKVQGYDRILQAGPIYRIGRDPGSDIVVADPRVSWQHALLAHDGGSWLLADAGSKNGTFVQASRVNEVTITSDCVARLGHPDDGPAISCSLSIPLPDAPGGPSPVSPPPAATPPLRPPRPCGRPAPC